MSHANNLATISDALQQMSLDLKEASDVSAKMEKRMEAQERRMAARTSPTERRAMTSTSWAT